jgi:hypothetical protein
MGKVTDRVSWPAQADTRFDLQSPQSEPPRNFVDGGALTIHHDRRIPTHLASNCRLDDIRQYQYSLQAEG